jgi:hypothetical protein
MNEKEMVLVDHWMELVSIDFNDLDNRIDE